MSVEPIDDISERVLALVANQTGWNPAMIAADTQIERDLGCAGDNAAALMEWMRREFDIDMSGFQFDRHFDNQGKPAWPLLVPMVVGVPVAVVLTIAIGIISQATGLEVGRYLAAGWLFPFLYALSVALICFATILIPNVRAHRVRKVPVTVQHLIDAARTKKWPITYPEGPAQ